jgi:hypothetical protein
MEQTDAPVHQIGGAARRLEAVADPSKAATEQTKGADAEHIDPADLAEIHQIQVQARDVNADVGAAMREKRKLDEQIAKALKPIDDRLTEAAKKLDEFDRLADVWRVKVWHTYKLGPNDLVNFDGTIVRKDAPAG